MARDFNISPRVIRHLEDDEFVVGSRVLSEQFPKKVIMLNPRPHPSSEIQRILNECRNNPSKKYFFTKIYCGNYGASVKEIAPLCLDALWMDNVYLPEEFIDEIANKANNNEYWRNEHNIDGERLNDLEHWYAWKKVRKYDEYLNILPSDMQKCIRESLIIMEQGRNLDGTLMQTLRLGLESARNYMISNGNIFSMKKDSDYGTFLRDALKGRGDQHIGEYYYLIYGLSNPGNHLKPANPNAINYRECLTNGQEQILARSLVYMLLDVLQWCSTLPKDLVLTKDSES